MNFSASLIIITAKPETMQPRWFNPPALSQIVVQLMGRVMTMA